MTRRHYGSTPTWAAPTGLAARYANLGRTSEADANYQEALRVSTA